MAAQNASEPGRNKRLKIKKFSAINLCINCLHLPLQPQRKIIWNAMGPRELVWNLKSACVESQESLCGIPRVLVWNPKTACVESTKGVNHLLKDVPRTQQRPELPTITLTWHASRSKANELWQNYNLKCTVQNKKESHSSWGYTFGGVYVPCITRVPGKNYSGD